MLIDIFTMESVGDQHLSKSWRVMRGVGRGLLLVSVLGLLAATMQRYSGWGLMEEREITPQKMRRMGELWTWRVGKRNFTPAEERGGALLENGKPTGSKAKRRHELERGPGWYRVYGSQLRFSPMDGSDPKVNGRRYSLRLPMEVRDRVWWILAGGFVLGFALTRGEVFAPVEEAARTWRRVPPWVKVAGFFVLFLGVRGLQLYGSDYNDGVMSIHGVPGSDAGGWHEMAAALADGRGFDSAFSTQRPFYSLFLSLFHLVFGSKIVVSLLVNCLLQALTATTVLVLGGILGSRFVAFTVASWMMFCPMQVGLAQVVLTENMGTTFGVLGLLVFWRLLRRRTVAAAAAAGLVVGVGNLASGVFLLTVPLYPVLLVLFGFWQRWGWRRVVACAAMFCVMVCALFVPWMYRQQVKFGAFTQSLNTAELLYGGAHPVEKRLTSALHDEARGDGFGSHEKGGGRYKYFMQKYVGVVKADPVGYLNQLSEAFVQAAEYTPRTNPVWQWLTRWLVVFVALGQCVRRKFWLPAIPAALALLLLHHVDDLPSLDSIAAGSLLVLVMASRRQRVGWWLVVTTAASFLLLAAMSGNVATDRFQTAGDWLLFLIWCGAWERVLVRSSLGLDWLWARVPGWRKPLPRRMVARAGAWRAHGWRWAGRTAWVMSILCGLSVVGSGVAYAWRVNHPATLMSVKAGQAEVLVERMVSGHPDVRVREIPKGAFSVELVQVDDFKVRIKKHEDLNSMTRVHERRDHARWVVEGRLLGKPGVQRLGMQIPGDLKGINLEQRLLAVGIVNRGYPDKFGKEMPLFEVLGLCPAKENGSTGEVEPLLEKMVWFKYHFDVKESVRRLYLKK